MPTNDPTNPSSEQKETKEEQSEPTTISALPAELVLKCFSFLVPSFRDIASVSGVCRHWNALVKNDDVGLWKQLCGHFGVDVDDDIESAEEEEEQGGGEEQEDTRPPTKFRYAFTSFIRAYSGYTSIYPRHKHLFKRLVKFLRESSPRTLQLFRPGVDPSRFPANLLEIPSDGEEGKAVKLWYSFVDGQKMAHGEEEFVGDFGVFGTLSVYNQNTSIRMLPSAVVKSFNFAGHSRMTVFALCVQSGKHFAILTSTPPQHAECLYHVVEVEFEGKRFIDHGLFSTWIENHISNLESGERAVDSLGRISLFPEHGLGTSSATTKGIRIDVSSLCALEHRNPMGQFVYRVKMTWVPELAEYPSAQLETRKWRIHYRSGAEEQVEGRAVVGFFPHLGSAAPAEQTFEYSSFCTGRHFPRGQTIPTVEGLDVFPGQDPPVWMEGSFVFVPGSLRNPILGEDKFEVEVGRWYFRYPSYLE